MEPVLGGISIEYSEFKDIEIMAASVLSKMKEVNWKIFSLNEKAEALSKYMAELWKVHIFREGNTRTIVTFVCQYTESIGIMLDTELFEKNSVYVRSALHVINKSLTGNDHKHTIDTIYKRNGICVKTLESRNSSNEYPKLLKQEGNAFYYQMPIGMSFKQVEKIHDIFESSFRSKVEITELKDHPDAHYSISIIEKSS